MSKLILLIALLSVTLASSEWSQMSTPPFQARHHPVTFDIDGIGYLTMGVGSTSFLKDFWKYDEETDTWEMLPSYPGEGRGYSYADVYEGKAYIGFGITNSDYMNDLWSYDPETEEWTQLSSCPCEGRAHPAFTIADGKLFVGLGNNATVGNMQDFWQYDIASDEWSQIENFPGLRRHHPFYFTVNEKVYVGLGHGNPNLNGTMGIYRDFYEYDPETEEWTELSPIPSQGRVAGTQFDFNGKGYVLSGQGEDHQNMQEGEFWEYDPATDNWTQLKSHPGISSRWAPGSFMIGSKLFFTSGLVGFGQQAYIVNSTLSYDFDIAGSVRNDLDFAYWYSNDNLHIELPDSREIEVGVYNLFGEEIFSQRRFLGNGINKMPIEINQSAFQSYFIRIKDLSSNKLGVVKIVE